MFTEEIFNGGTEYNLREGAQYIINSDVTVPEGKLQNPFLKRGFWKPVGYDVSELDEFTFIKGSEPGFIPEGIFTRFTVKGNNPVKIGFFIEYDTNEEPMIEFRLDNATLKGPLDQLTEKKTVIYDRDCLYKNFEVMFINSLGGRDTWTFRTYQDTGVNITDRKQIKRNIFSDFPNTFKNAQAQNDYVSVSSQNTLTLRAENLTEQQAIDLFELVQSTRVYDINDRRKPKVLLVDNNSVSITQGEKLYNLTFNVTDTFDIYRQRQ